MARERLFKAELIAVRKALGNGGSSSADRYHLVRWEDDHRAQEIWDRFKARNPTASPKDFIAYNLEARRYAEAAPAPKDSEDWRREWRDFFARSVDAIFDPRLSPSAATSMLRILCQDAARALCIYNSRIPPPQYVTRQTKTRKHEEPQHDANWRVHRLCIVILSDFWREQCGRAGDAEVAALVGIAFDAEISAETVRNVRRSIKAAATIAGELHL